MSDFNYDLDDFDENRVEPNDAMGQLRKALKAQQKLVKDRDAELATVREELTTLKSQVSSTTIAGLLEAKGAKPGLAKFMTDVEATDEAVTKWLTENGEIFGYKPKAEGDGEQVNETQSQAGRLDPELEAILASMAKVQNQEANAAPNLTSKDDKAKEFLDRVGQNAHSFDDVQKALRQAGLFSIPAGESHE
jgi:hypothetical protein